MDSLIRRLVLHVGILSTVLLVSIPLLTTNVQATPLSETAQSPELFYSELQIVYLTNLKRREQGLAPLRWNREISLSARWFAYDSVEQRTDTYCGHLDTVNRSPGDRLLFFNYTNPNTWGENVVCGFTSPESALNGWMNSEGHKKNILQTIYREIGVGYYRNSESGRGYIVQDFSYDPDYAPVIINNEAPSATTADVQLYIYNPAVQSGLEGMGDAVEMMIANDPTFANASWEPFAQEKNWTLEAGEGWRVVYVKTRDAQGRTTIVSDAIYLGASLPLDTLDLAQASTVERQLAFYNLDKSGWPQVQLSVNWQGDDSDALFEHMSGDGQEISDVQAIGGTVFQLSSTAPSHIRYWTTEFYKNVPLTAYFRLKVSDNQIGEEVLTIKISGGGTEYGPLILKGTDFAQPDTYQEFSLPFTFHENSDDPYLIFNVYGSGKSTVAIDRITIYTTAMLSQTRLDWEVLGGYYRSRGIWGRFINENGLFTEATELIPNAEAASLTLPISSTPPSTITTPQPLLYQVLLPVVSK